MILSIVTVCYNAANTITRTLDSILEAVNEIGEECSFEYIIVDGGSNDNTLNLITNFCTNHKFSRYISEQDDGIYDAYNKGIKMAHGAYVWFVNADDAIKPNAIRTIFESIRNNQSAAVHCFSLNRVHPETGIGELKIRNESSPISILSPVCHTPSIIWSVSTLQSLGGFDITYKICADFKALQLLLKNNYVFIGRNSLIIDMYLGGISSQYNFELLKATEQLKVICSSGFPTLLKWKAILNVIFKLFRNLFINPFWRRLKF